MAGIPKQIIQNLFGRDRLEEIPLENLRELLNEYPSFNAGHFLLSKKLKMEGSNEFSQQTQRTALHFTNPFWLQFLLERESNGTGLALPVQAATELLKPQEEPLLSMHKQSLFAVYAVSDIHEETSSVYSPDLPDQIGEELKIEHTAKQEAQPFESMGWTGHDVEKDEKVKEEFSSMTKPMQDPDDLMEESLADIAMSRVDEEAQLPQAEDSFIKEEHSTENANIVSGSPEQEKEIPEFSQEMHSPKSAYGEYDTLDESREESPEYRHADVHVDIYQQEQATEEAEPITDSHDDHRQSEPGEPVFSGQESELESPANKADQSEQRPYYFWEKEFYTTKYISEPNDTKESAGNIAGPNYDYPSSTTLPEEELVNESESPGETKAEHIDKSKGEAEPQIVFEQDPIILGPFSSKQEESLPISDAPESYKEPEPTLAVSYEMPKPAMDEPLEELQFTPYHTIDYFASQGIQYEQEENPTDKFGKQLKSFTAWLKSMKKLPKAVLEAEMSDITEAAIQSIAEHSIEEKEVITEAMAEVLVLQGKTDKAIELYRKLSLLNPAKSAFFAARIDQIKVN